MSNEENDGLNVKVIPLSGPLRKLLRGEIQLPTAAEHAHIKRYIAALEAAGYDEAGRCVVRHAHTLLEKYSAMREFCGDCAHLARGHDLLEPARVWVAICDLAAHALELIDAADAAAGFKLAEVPESKRFAIGENARRAREVLAGVEAKHQLAAELARS